MLVVNLLADLTLCSHPGPTLRALELLQQERFRKEISNPAVMNMMELEGQRNAVPGQKDRD
jgi:mediator of RNA polymerase II transcription subunit 31